MHYKAFKSTLFVVLALSATLILAACGDSPTATTAPTTAATTVAATTAAPATTVATTAAVATTVATTVAATTAAATTAAPTTAAATTAATSAVSLPTISGAQEVNFGPAAIEALLKEVPGLNTLKNPIVKVYVSDNEADKLAESADVAFTGAGYKFGLPGGTKPIKQDDNTVGFYTKTGAPDILFATGAIGDTPFGQANIPGLSADEVKKVTDQVKGKKSLIFVVAAPNLLQNLLSAAASASPAATTAVAAATTPASATTAATTGTATGPGSELVGQLIAVGDSDVRVKSVSQFNELKGTTKTATPKGVFMVVVLEVANLGKKPSALSFLNLKDDKNRQFTTTTDGDAIGAVVSKPEFKSSLLINPGFVGIEVKTYDVPKDAAGFKIEADPFINKNITRKPSAESFSISGGKGPDSGTGKELVGKTFTSKEKVTATVSAVDRLSEIKGRTKSFKPEGVYLVVQYDVKNDGDKPTSFLTFYLKDSEGRFFSTSADFDLAFELGATGKYKNDLNINPGQSGKGYKVFEVVKEAGGFEMIESYF